MSTEAIWAQSIDGIIGISGTLPWDLPEDMAHFRKRTFDRTIIMGRRTWESLPVQPLRGRHNVILTRDLTYRAPEGVDVIHNIEDITRYENPVIIGGADIYNQAMRYVDTLRVTTVGVSFAGSLNSIYGTRAPDIGSDFEPTKTTEWLPSTGKILPNGKNNPFYRITTYKRRHH